MKFIKKILLVLILLFVIISGFIFWKNYNLQKGIANANEEFENYIPPKISNWGTVEQVSIIPIIDRHTSSTDFRTEAGVSYLIKTDKQTILFDLGYNPRQESPSPLEHNMVKLGITLNSISMIVISHNHFDHVGGKKWMDGNTFSLGNVQNQLMLNGCK